MLLTRYGKREWGLASVVAIALAAALGLLQWWWALLPVGLAWFAVAMFFRDPVRRVPEDLGPEVMVSPADGVVSAIERVPTHPVIGGPAVIVRVFLSVLNVHVNRSACDGQVTGLQHRPGRYHDARSAECPLENESQLIEVRMHDGRPVGMRQIAGKVARRIVCPLEIGDRLRRGERFGMIKFGSSTELILPDASTVHVAVGDRVRAGVTVLAEVPAPTEAAQDVPGTAEAIGSR